MTTFKLILAALAGVAGMAAVWFGVSHVPGMNTRTAPLVQEAEETKGAGTDPLRFAIPRSDPRGNSEVQEISGAPIVGQGYTGTAISPAASRGVEGVGGVAEAAPGGDALSRSPQSAGFAQPTANFMPVPSAEFGQGTGTSAGTNGGYSPSNDSAYGTGGGNSTAAMQKEIEIPVPAGEMVPVAFLDETPRPAPQQRALDRIVSEFTQSVSMAGDTPSPEVWRQAKEVADSRYIALFGFRKYNEMHLMAAREALQEKKALSSSGTQP